MADNLGESMEHGPTSFNDSIRRSVSDVRISGDTTTTKSEGKRSSLVQGNKAKAIKNKFAKIGKKVISVESIKKRTRTFAHNNRRIKKEIGYMGGNAQPFFCSNTIEKGMDMMLVGVDMKEVSERVSERVLSSMITPNYETKMPKSLLV